MIWLLVIILGLILGWLVFEVTAYAGAIGFIVFAKWLYGKYKFSGCLLAIILVVLILYICFKG